MSDTTFSKNLKILIVEDISSDAELTQLALADFDYQCNFQVCSSKIHYLELLQNYHPDIILSDFNVPGFNVISALTKLREADELTPFIFITGGLTEENAVEAIRVGATDFILKKNLDQLPAAILRAMREKKEKIGRRKALDQLKANERRFERLVQEGSDLIGIIDIEANYLFVSESSERILGIKPEEFVGKNAFDFIHPEDQVRVRHLLSSIGNSKRVKIGPFQFRNHAYKWRWLEAVATNALDEASVQGIIVNSRDITEKKEAEQALEKSLTQLKTAQQIAKLGYWSHDFRENRSHWTEEMFLIWEQNQIKWKPTFRNLATTVHPDDRHNFKDFNIEKLKNTTVPNREYRISTPAGQTKWISEIITVHRDAEGQPLKVDGVAQDITARKNLELLYREIGRLARVGAWTLDLGTNTLFWSTITKKIHEVEAEYEPRLDTAINFYKSGQSRNTIQNHLRDAMELGTSFDVELQIVTAEGNERWVRAIGKPEFHKGKCVRIVGSFQDVHARKVAEEERKEILESITDGLFAVDKTWKVIFWNTAASQMLGVSTTEEIVGQELWAEVPILKKSRFYPQAHQALEKQQPFVAVEEFKARKRWFEISLFPKSGGLSVYFKDITKETEQQQQILKIKNNLDTTINSTNDLIFSIDANMCLISANRAFRDRLKVGFNAEIKEGYPIKLASASREAMAKWQKHLARALTGEQFTVAEEDALGGQTYYSLVSFNPFIENGLCTGVACFVKDITERTIHLNAIEEQNQRLRDIAWMQSHVVRAPVARIMGLIELISSDHSKEEDKAQLLQYVDLSAKQLDGIIRDITAKTAKIDPLGDGD